MPPMSGIADVALMQSGRVEKGQQIEGWFEVHMSIMVGDPSENPKMDGVVLKIDAPNIGGTAPHKVSNEIKDIQVELVKYIKG